jgi:hypothetical protein
MKAPAPYSAPSEAEKKSVEISVKYFEVGRRSFIL